MSKGGPHGECVCGGGARSGMRLSATRALLMSRIECCTHASHMPCGALRATHPPHTCVDSACSVAISC